MARDIESKVTATGLAVIAKCIALGIPVAFTRAAIGTGTALDEDDISAYSDLIDWYDDAAIASRNYVGATLSIALQYYNSNVGNVVDIGELALFATDPDLGEVIFSYTTLGQYVDKLLPIQQTPILRTYEVVIDFTNGASVSVTINPAALLPATDAVDTPTAGKLLRLNSAGKLPTSITGDAATVGGKAASSFANAEHGHANASQSGAGFLSVEDKQKIDGRLGQAVNTNSSPTFANITLGPDGVIHNARFEA